MAFQRIESRGSGLPRSMWLALALIALPFVALAAIELDQLVWRRPALRLGHEQVVRSLDALAAAQQVENAMQDAERGQRGFLLTGDPAYLEPYRSGTTQAPVMVEKLRQLTAGEPAQRPRLAELGEQIGLKIVELKSTLDAREHGGASAALSVMRTNAGLDSMRRITWLIDEITSTEKALMANREAELESARRSTELAQQAGVVIALILMLLGVILVPLVFDRYLKSRREQLRNEQRFLHFVDSVTDYAVFMLDQDGIVISWNAGAQRIKGYAANEIIGQHFSRFYTEDDRNDGKPARALATAARDGRFEDQGLRVRSDGSTFFAAVVMRPITDETGKVIGYAKITRDVTEQMKQRLVLKQTRAALAQSQKMEALGQLSSGIAHDFNNLLHVIKNCAEILQRRQTGADAETGKLFEMIRRNAERASGLTQRLLAFSRRQPLAPRAVDPNRLVADVSELLRRTVGEAVALETVLGGGVWPCLADANQLEAAIVNLAVNARDAMPDGGRLTIETANAHLDEAYERGHPYVRPGQYVMIAVSDTGTGMTPEVAARAFEPFFTTKDVGQGTGLGLSQVYGFIKQSGGHVKIYSEPGAGTTVKLYLPRASEASAEEAPVPDATREQAASLSETVLLVEDEEDVRRFTASLLEELGYRTLVAADAHAAIRILEREASVDLLFTDVGLPHGVNGRQLADQAVARWPGLKVLFTTAYTRNAIVHHGRLDAGVELIAKPFTRAELAEKLRKILGAPAHESG